MPKFAIITPTIGRDVLQRCLLTMRRQVLQDYVQIVVGDGPQERWVQDECLKDERVYYTETKSKEGFYGTEPRNHALKMIEDGVFGPVDYVLFVDDDNVLLEPTLYNLREAIETGGRPPLLWYDILFTNKYQTRYFILPRRSQPVQEGDWDSLNGVFRADVIKDLRWNAVYNHDHKFAIEAQLATNEKQPGVGWTKVEGIGAIHFLSWDTYELVRKA